MLKSIFFVLILIMLCSAFQLIHGDDLQCKFEEVGAFRTTFYSCSVTELDNPNDNIIITEHSGVHQPNKYDSDVKTIWIHDTNTKYIPEGLGSLFNLTALLIQRSRLFKIRSRDFQGMQNLEYLSLYNNKLITVPSDTFSTLPKLKEIYLNSNRITFIALGAFDKLTNLNKVYLSNNECGNKNYEGITAILQMKEEIKTNCDPHEIIISLVLKSGKYWLDLDSNEFTMEEKEEEEEEEEDTFENETLDTDLTIKFEYEKKIIELIGKLTNCETNQQKSMEFNLCCDFLHTNRAYTCETRDLTIHHKEMKLNEVKGNHLRSYSKKEVTELIIVKSSMFYWSNDIFTKLPALQTLRIQNAQLNELKEGDFSSASKLQVLLVNGNNIALLGDDVFHGTEEHLTKINLNSNQIEKISAGTFHGLKQLKVLSLKENLITEIPLGTFKDIVMLEILILTGNKIKFIDGKMLQFNKRLMTLAVDQNELREVGEEILDHSVELLDVNLEGNDCIDERTTINDDDTDGRTINDLIFVIRNCCKNSGEGLNVYSCGLIGAED